MSHSSTSIADARAIFGTSMLAPDDVAALFAVAPDVLDGNATTRASVPYARTTLEDARERGNVLVFRTGVDGTGPLTLLRLLERFPETLQESLRKGVGYQLKDEWTVTQEPFAATATCRSGWRLVHSGPIAATCNLNYEQQDEALRRYAGGLPSAPTLMRRSAIEAACDTILLHRVHGTRLLEGEWDWSETPTQDGGYITVGEFGKDGLRIVGYSKAVRFGTLGICPQQ